MKLSTLLVLGAFLFGGLYVARNADNWVNSVKHSLNREKAELTAAAKERLQTERDKAVAAINERLQSERDKAAAALKKRVDSAKERTGAAVQQGVEGAKERTGAAVQHGVEIEKTTSDNLASAGMSEAAFWQLIAETRTAAGGDTGGQSELLKERLTRLSPQAITGFEDIRHRLDERAYSYDLWGAAYVIEDGCSDDCFRDFRGYLISLGPGAYANALRNPDSLASVVQDAEAGNWENADDVAPDAYSSVTGNDFPREVSDLSGLPRGTPFDENDSSALARRYPQLTARFR